MNKTDWNALSDAEFQAIAREFFETRCPARLKHLPRRPRWTDVKEWYTNMSEAGWLTPTWPVVYGGMGLDASKYIIYVEEMERQGCPRVMDQGIMNLGPVLIAKGTEEQRQHYLPKIHSAEHLWCQGYSEPNAGSDLASLRTEARLEGDEFVVNGQKIWTSAAYDANHIFALVRTDKTVKKQAGISFLLLDMNQPGIVVKPFKNMGGVDEQCSVFFDNARTPATNLVGKLNDGWNVAKALLGFERVWSGSPRQSLMFLYRLQQMAKLTGKLDDPVFVDRLTQVTFDVLDINAVYQRLVGVMKTGGTIGLESSMLKIWATETCQRVGELTMEAAEECGGLMGSIPFGDKEFDLLYPFLDARAWTIYGGSNQVQRNILAKGVLNLPS